MDWRPKECGYPEFEIKCDNGFTATKMINGMQYHVLDINPIHHVIALARRDYRKGECLKKIVNTTLDTTHFHYAPGTKNLTVMYGCKSRKTRHFGEFTCNVSGVSDKNGYYVPGIVNPNGYGCCTRVVVPIMNILEPQIPLIGLSKVFRKLFEAKYLFRGPDEEFCKICEREPSGGNCGYDNKIE